MEHSCTVSPRRTCSARNPKWSIEGQTSDILDSVPMGLAFLDAQGTILESNSKLRDLTGRGPRELVGRPALELVHHEDKQSVARPFRALAQRADSIEIEPLRLVAPDGTVRRVRLRAGALRGSTGQVERFAVLIEDAESRTDVENSLVDLDVARAASRAKDELLASLGHEVRTPINAIVGFAQLLLTSQEMQSASASRQWVQRILEAGWHLLAMTQETLELGRLEAGCMQVSVAPVEVAPIVEACVQMLRCRAAEQQVTIEATLSPCTAVVLADATRLTQVLLNVISNAIKYNRVGGHVVLDARRWGDGVEICVSDTGIGMSADQQRRLFEPFNRLGRESSSVEGTGIGLVISRKLTELMGGSMAVHSVASVGTMVTIGLRMAQSG